MIFLPPFNCILSSSVLFSDSNYPIFILSALHTIYQMINMTGKESNLRFSGRNTVVIQLAMDQCTVSIMNDSVPKPWSPLGDSWRVLQRGYRTRFKSAQNTHPNSRFFRLLFFSSFHSLKECTYFMSYLLQTAASRWTFIYFALLKHFTDLRGNAGAEDCMKTNRTYSECCSAAEVAHPSYSKPYFQDDTQKLPVAETSLRSTCGQAPYTLGLCVCGSHIRMLFPICHLAESHLSFWNSINAMAFQKLPLTLHLKQVSLLQFLTVSLPSQLHAFRIWKYVLFKYYLDVYHSSSSQQPKKYQTRLFSTFIDEDVSCLLLIAKPLAWCLAQSTVQ